MEPVKSKSSKFVERWANAEQLSIKLGLALVCTSAVSIVLVLALVYVSNKPKPIYYIPGAWEAGVAMPQTIPETAISVFVSSWVLNWSNFTPATVEDVYKRAQRFMSPKLLAQTQSRLVKDMEDVKKNKISSSFSQNQEPLVMADKVGFSVKISGDKAIYVGKEEIKIQKMIYHVRIKSVHPTDNNPYGLIIEEIDQEVVL
jgi:hypothetical protein